MTKRPSHEEILKIATDFMEKHVEAFKELAKIERKELMTDVAQKLVDAGHRVSDNGVPLGKLIREGHQDPMSARVRYEYAAVLRELVNELQQGNFVRICDILNVADELEGL